MPQKKTSTKTIKRPSAGTVGDSLPYKLVFDERGVGIAKLSSRLLDPLMHDGGVVRVDIGDFASGEHGRDNVLAIDSFQVDSLRDYLSGQAAIRDALTKAVDAHLAACDFEPKHGRKIGRGVAIWEEVKISFVQFSPRRVPTPEKVAALRQLFAGMTDESFAAKLAGEASARSEFELCLSGPWPDEHERWAHFRNGQLVNLNLQG